MKHITTILFLAYYSFGTFCLPQGDFSAIADLSKMYAHCKATEDKDMTLIDFFTDHLINMDGLFDKHDNGDKQKPHSPVQFHHSPIQPTIVTQQLKVSINKPVLLKTDFTIYTGCFYFSEFSSYVFRPPVV